MAASVLARDPPTARSMGIPVHRRRTTPTISSTRSPSIPDHQHPGQRRGSQARLARSRNGFYYRSTARTDLRSSASITTTYHMTWNHRPRSEDRQAAQLRSHQLLQAYIVGAMSRFRCSASQGRTMPQYNTRRKNLAARRTKTIPSSNLLFITYRSNGCNPIDIGSRPEDFVIRADHARQPRTPTFRRRPGASTEPHAYGMR